MILIRLTFFSRNRLVRPEAGSVAEILAASRSNNRRDDITAALIHDERWFAQELEGSETALSVTFERILRDRRHADVSLVTMQPVAERRYRDAAMIGVARGGNNDDLFRHYCDGARFDPRSMRADRISDLVEAVVARAAQATNAA
jgi:hypothetical protein